MNVSKHKPRMKNGAGYRKAFTLAEILITLAIVGVVAVLVIPSVATSVQTRARARQVEVSKVKFNKAAQMMALNSDIGPYYTDGVEFVQNLGKYLKINQICRVGSTPNNLPAPESCLGEKYAAMKTADGDSVQIASLGSGGSSFGIDKNDDTNSWTTPTVAFYTIDGTRYILSYNTKCPEVQPGVYDGNAASACIAGVADVDGDKKPNQIGKDAYFIGAAKSLGHTCIGKSLGFCFSAPINPKDLSDANGMVSYSECNANASDWGLPTGYCDGTLSYYKEYNWYATLARECGSLSKIASPSEMAAVINYIYDIGSSYRWYGGNMSNLTFDDAAAARAAEFGLADIRTTGFLFLISTHLYKDGNYYKTTMVELLPTRTEDQSNITANDSTYYYWTFCKL